MTKQRERIHRKKQQRTQSRWMMAAGLAFLVIAVLWLVFSNRDSENSGALPVSRLTTNDFHSLAFSPTEPETVFFGHHKGLLVSHNGGKDWQPTVLNNADVMVLGIAPSNSQTMYVAGHNVFIKSNDGGNTWQGVHANLPGLDIHAFAVDPENADKVVAYVVSFGLFGSEDGGINWESLSVSSPPSVNGLVFGEDDQTLYAAADGAGLWQSQDGGRSWSPIPTVPNNGAIAVAYVPANGRLYLTTLEPAAGLHYSDDGGETWTSTSLRETILAVAISPLDSKHIMAVNDQGEVFASRDGGISWLDE